MFTAPTLAPLDAVAAVSAIVLRPEVEIERRDKKDPVEGRECAGVGRVIRLGRAQMQRVGVPGPRGIAVLDEAIPNLYKRDRQHLRIARQAKKKKGTYVLCCCSHAVLVDLDKIVDGLKSYTKSMIIQRVAAIRCISVAFRFLHFRIVPKIPAFPKMRRQPECACRMRMTYSEDKVRADHDWVCGIWRASILVFKVTRMQSRKNSHKGELGERNGGREEKG